MITKEFNREFNLHIKLNRPRKTFLVFIFFFVYLQSLAVSGQRPGDLDYSFNGNGFVTTSITSDTEQASDVVIQPDGKIVVVGDARSGSNVDFVVIRYNPDGTLDPTFDADGIVTTTIGNGNEEARAVALQSDGKIVVAGYSDDRTGSADFAIVRYNSNGSLDTTFNRTGKVTTSIGSMFDYAEDVAIQTDGKIVVAGRFSTGSNSNEDIAVVRYNADGTIDTDFGTDGKAATAAGPGKETVGAVLLQADGKIIVAGSANSSVASNFEFYDFALVRYKPNGTLDDSFDFDGIVTTPVGALADFGADAQLQPDGKIVVTGLTQGADYNFGTVRYNSDGSLDSTFGDNGKVITDLGGHESAGAISIQTDGKIIVAGGNYGFTLICYRADGDLDDDFFGVNGMTAKPDGSARALAIQADGKLVAAGISPYNGAFDIRLARYLGTGAPAAQNAVIKGKVLSPTGKGMPGTLVQMIKQNGKSRSVLTNASGLYQFDNVEAGQNVILKVVSNQFRFQPQIITTDKNIKIIMNLIHQGDGSHQSVKNVQKRFVQKKNDALKRVLDKSHKFRNDSLAP